MTAQTQTATPSTKVITGKCRGSYVNVFQPRRNELNGREEYSIALLIPKSDRATVAAIRAACDAAADTKWGNKRPARLDSPLRDGDGERPRGGAYPEEYADHWVVNTKSTQRPGVVDLKLQDVIEPLDFISGDYCRASLTFYAYDQAGNRGVGCGLNNIQVVAKGDPLSSRSRAADDFGGAANTATNDDDIPW